MCAISPPTGCHPEYSEGSAVAFGNSISGITSGLVTIQTQPQIGGSNPRAANYDFTGDTSMLPWWKRLSFSFLSVLFGGGIVGVAAASRDALLNPGAHFDTARLLVSACIVIIASLSGWLVAVPIVLLVRDYRGWRLWGWGAVGICIGPAVILGFALYVSLTEPSSTRFAAGASGFLLLSAAVSTLSTCAYLFFAHGRRQA
jgi:hypothetical protein